MKKFGPYLIFVAAMLWATDAPFRVFLTESLSSNFIVLAEHFVDVLFVLPILFLNFSEIKKLNYKEWLAVICIAVGGSALASIAFTQAFHYVNPSVAILLQKLQPFIAVGLATALLKDHLTKKFWLWALLAMVGAYLISFPKFIPKTFDQETFTINAIGVSLALVAALFWGASTVLGKYMLNKVNFKVMTSLRFTLAFVFLLLINIQQKSFPDFATLTAKHYLYIVIVAITSGVVSLFIYYKGLETTQASVATFAELGFPVAAVAINWYFLKEALVPMQLLGVLILLLGVYGLAIYNRKIQEPLGGASIV